MKKLLLLLCGLSVVAAMAQAQEPSLATMEGADDLEKVKRAKFRETYVNMNADFTRYNKLYLGDAFFDYRDVGPAQRSRSTLEEEEEEEEEEEKRLW